MTRPIIAGALALALATAAGTGGVRAQDTQGAMAGMSGMDGMAGMAGMAPAADPAADPAAAAAARPAGLYAFDPHHAQAVFSYQHMGFSTSFGVVNEIEGAVTLDPDDPSKSSVEASFPITALRTISPALDGHLLSADFFNATEGEIRFVSTAVEPTGDLTARVTGDLTMNGVTRPVVLEMTLNQAALNPIEQRPAVGFTGKAVLKRSDFNLGQFAPAVSDAVEIILNVEAIKGD